MITIWSHRDTVSKIFITSENLECNWHALCFLDRIETSNKNQYIVTAAPPPDDVTIKFDKEMREIHFF